MGGAPGGEAGERSSDADGVRSSGSRAGSAVVAWPG
jgi:hypothetical protein